MEQNLFVNGTEFKAKDSKIVAAPSCLGNISKDWSVDNMNDTGLIGYVYDFSVDYDAIAVENILNIQKYLMKKNNMIYKRLGLLKCLGLFMFGCFFLGLTILSNVNL